MTDLLKEAGGDKGSLNTLEKLTKQEAELKRELDELLHDWNRKQKPDNELDNKIVDAANKAASKTQQVEAVGRQINENLMKNQDAIGAIVAQAAQSAVDKAEDTAAAISAWGTGDGAGPEQMKLDRTIVDRVRSSPALAEAAKHLGRFREMAAKAKKNCYAYGRGEKYTLELGNDLSRVLTSELSMLATPEAIPLFLRKYQNRRLHQYKRREPVFKGAGDIIVCLDESSSTRQDAPWGKAVALALLDTAMAGSRKFALIHFSSGSKCKTDLLLPGEYSMDDVFAAVETFLGGGTDFDAPLREAMRLIENEGFENADIVFVTDGECALPSVFCDELTQKKSTHKFKITGVVMDVESPGMTFSLKPFCEEVYRTSELSRDRIVESIISDRV